MNRKEDGLWMKFYLWPCWTKTRKSQCTNLIYTLTRVAFIRQRPLSANKKVVSFRQAMDHEVPKVFYNDNLRVACCNIQAAISVRAPAHDIVLLGGCDRVGTACLMVFHYRVSDRVIFQGYYDHKLRLVLFILRNFPVTFHRSLVGGEPCVNQEIEHYFLRGFFFKIMNLQATNSSYGMKDITVQIAANKSLRRKYSIPFKRIPSTEKEFLCE